MSEEVEEAIERVEDTIYNHSGYGINHFKKITFYEDGIEDIKKLLNYIKELEETLKCTQNSWYSDTKKIKELEQENDSKEKAYNDCYCEFKHYKQYDSIPKQVIRDKILYYKSFGIHKVNNGLIGEKFSEWTEYVMQDEIDILKELLEEE